MKRRFEHALDLGPIGVSKVNLPSIDLVAIRLSHAMPAEQTHTSIGLIRRDPPEPDMVYVDLPINNTKAYFLIFNLRYPFHWERKAHGQWSRILFPCHEDLPMSNRCEGSWLMQTGTNRNLTPLHDILLTTRGSLITETTVSFEWEWHEATGRWLWEALHNIAYYYGRIEEGDALVMYV